MKALVVKQPWASLIAYGEKTIEHRSWSTDHRGPLLIVAGAKPFHDGEEVMPFGVAVALVDVRACVPFNPSVHGAAAGFEPDDCPTGGYAWVLKFAKEVHPVRVVGRQRLFDVDILPTFVDEQDEKDHYDLFADMLAAEEAEADG